MHLEVSSAKFRPFCLGLNSVLMDLCDMFAHIHLPTFLSEKSHLLSLLLCIVAMYRMHYRVSCGLIHLRKLARPATN